MMRSLASVPMAENISAYLAICSEVCLAWACTIFRYLQKYSLLSSALREPPCPTNRQVFTRPVWRVCTGKPLFAPRTIAVTVESSTYNSPTSWILGDGLLLLGDSSGDRP